MTDKRAKPLNTEILLIADSSEDMRNIQHLLAEDFGGIIKTDIESMGVSLFKKHHPTLLILAFDEVALAEKFYLSLYRLDSQIYTEPHKTLLLCKGSESKQAYELCKAGIMDDFVVNRPLFDPFRLRLSVSLALKRYKIEQNSFWLNQHIEKVSKGMHKFNHFIQDKLIQGSDQQNVCAGSFFQFTKSLSTDLGQLEKNLTSLALNADVFRDDTAAVSEQIKQFRESVIVQGSRQVAEKIETQKQWIGEFNEGLDAYREKIGPDPSDKTIIQVMVVDDDDMYREMLITMLKSKNIQVMAVSDGQTALRSLMIYKPDIILLDYLMPVVDGLTVLKDIKSNPDTKKIPVIMLTGDSSREVVGGSIHAGAAKFLVKPSDRATIISKIQEVLAVKK